MDITTLSSDLTTVPDTVDLELLVNRGETFGQKLRDIINLTNLGMEKPHTSDQTIWFTYYIQRKVPSVVV